jgi:predicted nucleotidyltransferase
MYSQKFVIKRLGQFVTELKSSGIHLRKVILYSSYAKNKQHQWSDVDVALVADEFKGDGFYDVGLFATILIKYNKLLMEPRTYSPAQFASRKDPFVDEIIKTGIEIKV